MTAPPHDLAAEDALLGDMLAFPETIGQVAELVTPQDFYQPYAAASFGALVGGWREGQPIDVVALAAVLKEIGLEPSPGWLVGVVSSGTAAWRRHAEQLITLRVRRQLIAAGQIINDARKPGVDPRQLIDELQQHLAGIHIPDGSPPRDLSSLDEFIDRPENAAAPWVIPGLLRRGWRVMVVAGEGMGKSTLWRQVAICAAQGLHPLGFQPMTKTRTLLIDLENPADAISDGCRPIRDHVARRQTYEPGRAWLWHRPGGVNLRARGTRAELASVLAATRPDLVCLGPLYKAYTRGRDSDEEAAAEVQECLDDLRTRFGFALLIEHHAPQDAGGARKLRPYGSSLWLRWPEIGLAMVQDHDTPGAMRLERWRGDRMQAMWPDRLDRDQGSWPWTGRWEDDSWRRIGA